MYPQAVSLFGRLNAILRLIDLIMNTPRRSRGSQGSEPGVRSRGQGSQGSKGARGQVLPVANLSPQNHPMARPLRIEFADAVHHVTSRGDRREAIYRDDEDRQRHLAVIAQAMDRFDAQAASRCVRRRTTRRRRIRCAGGGPWGVFEGGGWQLARPDPGSPRPRAPAATDHLAGN